ncbi:MAG: TIGR00270 family protein [Euryarchaeota archaeon]|nr:TIGR00270 family protein [Euryarchaeota archaeon]
MECEVCGRTIEKPFYVKIEGSEMRTCAACSKFGVQIKRQEQKKQAAFKYPQLREEKTIPKVGATPLRLAHAMEYVENYGEAIRNARQRRGLTQEELGKLINEKMSVIARLESEKMVPTAELAKKLEKSLDIQLLEELEEEKITGARAPAGELTIGDVIKIRKGK